jgi:hypothetical protein
MQKERAPVDLMALLLEKLPTVETLLGRLAGAFTDPDVPPRAERPKVPYGSPSS